MPLRIYFFDGVVVMWKNVKISPWIGEQYANPDIFQFKTLILGESNYTSKENFQSDLVIKCIKDHIGLNEDPNFSRFATKIRKVIFSRDNIDTNTFWKNVSFYNFIQDLVGETSKTRPTEQMWQKSMTAFNEIINILEPERILVLGIANWKNLLSHLEHREINQYKSEFYINNKKFIAGYILHPSSPSGFKYNTWQPIVEEILHKI